jgi:hypothetical protein
LIKSTAYKVYWAGRYLERLENIARFSLLLLDKGLNLDDLNKALGVDDVFSYLASQFEVMREDLRAVAGEEVMNALASMEASVYASKEDVRRYFLNLQNSSFYLGRAMEDELGPNVSYFPPKKQEEIGGQ